MATTVKIRASVFIPMAWVLAFDDPQTGTRIEYAGDDRGFAAPAGRTVSSRIIQEVTVDFSKRELRDHADTGISCERKRGPDGRVQYREGKSDPSGITVENLVWWNTDLVTFDMRTCAGNPLIENADNVDYLVHVAVLSDGRVTLKGAHDGFPCYEFYKQVDGGAFTPLYTFDHRKLGTTPQALAGPMAYAIDSTV